jgi:hypothetical protein
LIASPVVRTHPCGQSRPHGRRTVPRGVTRASRGSGAESSAGTGSAQSRQAVSAATRSSLPHRGPPTVAGCHASRSLARPFRAHRRAMPASPPDCTLLGFRPLQRMRSRGFGSRAPRGARARPCDLDAGVPHLPPSGPSVSHALAGFHPATPFRACFIPVTLLGFRLQGLCPPPGSRTSLEAACSLAVSSAREAGQLRARIAASEP